MPEKNKIPWSRLAPQIFLVFIFFLIPFEHKYDKLFRKYSISLLPHNIKFPIDFDPKIYFYISDLIALVFFTWALWYVRRRYVEQGASFLFALFGLAFFSIVFSPCASVPIIYMRLLQLFTPIALFFFLSNGPISGEKSFKIWSWSLFSAGIVESFFAISQYFSQHSLGLRLIGEQPLGASITVPHGHRWIFDELIGRNASPILFRATGTMPHPNVLGGFLMLSLLIGIYFYYRYDKQRPWLALAHVLMLFALTITFSRSAIFGYAIAATIFLLWIFLKHKSHLRSLTTLCIFSALAVGTLLHEPIFFRGGIVSSTSISRGSNQERLFYQKITLKMIQKHPLSGVGFGQYNMHIKEYLPPGTDPSSSPAGSVHNIFLLVAAELGIPALALLLFWLAFLLRRIWCSSITSPEEGLLLGALIGYVFISNCDLYPIFFQQGKLLFFGIAALAARISSDKAELCRI